MQPIEFWLSLTSPYSYLTAMRVFDLQWDFGLDINWRPIFMPPLFKALGWKVNPFADHPPKLEYMFKDVKREAGLTGIEFHRPAIFPQNAQLATQLAMLAFEQGFGVEFCYEALVANYQERCDIACKDDLCRILERVCPPAEAARLMRRCDAKKVAEAVQQEGLAAIERGVFGVPTFFVDREQFWGNDRLDRALDYSRRKSTSTAFYTNPPVP